MAALSAWLSQDPVARLHDTAPVVLVLRLGLRAGEAASLELADLPWRTETVSVPARAGGCCLPFEQAALIRTRVAAVLPR